MLRRVSTKTCQKAPVCGVRRPPAGGLEVRQSSCGSPTAHVLLLPKTDGKYAMLYNRDRMLSRWRFENGQWRLY
jgi:hypothetical protein